MACSSLANTQFGSSASSATPGFSLQKTLAGALPGRSLRTVIPGKGRSIVSIGAIARVEADRQAAFAKTDTLYREMMKKFIMFRLHILCSELSFCGSNWILPIVETLGEGKQNEKNSFGRIVCGTCQWLWPRLVANISRRSLPKWLWLSCTGDCVLDLRGLQHACRIR